MYNLVLLTGIGFWAALVVMILGYISVRSLSLVVVFAGNRIRHMAVLWWMGKGGRDGGAGRAKEGTYEVGKEGEVLNGDLTHYAKGHPLFNVAPFLILISP